jgi:hypothetical protein
MVTTIFNDLTWKMTEVAKTKVGPEKLEWIA